MNRIAVLASSILLTGASAVAQSSAPSGTQSWTGILVAAGCQAASPAPHSHVASKGSEDMPKATPTVTAREQNRPFEEQANQADRSARPAGSNPVRDHVNATDQVKTPPVDSVDTRGSAPFDGPALGAAGKVTGTEPSCRVEASTSAFALRLHDGTLVRFDDASNAKIAQQLQSGGKLKRKNKAIRATVKGSLRGGAIGLDSLSI